MLAFFALVCWLTTLTFGAMRLVRWWAWLALKRHVPEVILGLTLVTLGTTMPEFVVNISAVLGWAPDLAIWNIVWSNIVNILLILSLAAVIRPLVLDGQLSTTDVLFCLLAPVLLWLVSADSVFGEQQLSIITRNDGIVLLLCFVGFVYHLYRSGQHEDASDEVSNASESTVLLVVYCVAGVIWLVWGATLTLFGARTLATMRGIGEHIIWLTIIAFGTSLPELVTMIMAVIKRHGSLAIGNLLGSCVFNVFWTLWVSSLFHPLRVSVSERTDMLVSIFAMSLIVYSFFFSRSKTIWRRQGALGLFFYVCYMVYTFVMR